MASSFWIIIIGGFSVLTDFYSSFSVLMEIFAGSPVSTDFYSSFSVLMEILAGSPVSDRPQLQCPPH